MKNHKGFSLIEVAIVLVILGLVLGMSLVPVGIQMENAERKETKATMQQIREALLGFVMANGRLPCPDTDGDGDEDYEQDTTAATITCYRCGLVSGGSFTTEDTGFLPTTNLGVKGVDAWDRKFHYRITQKFADDNNWNDTSANCDLSRDHSFELTDSGDIQVWNEDFTTDCPGCTSATPGNLASAIPVIVVSEGKQRMRSNSLDEAENTEQDGDSDGTPDWDDDGMFVDKTYTQVEDKEFDDLVLWISSHELKKSLVDAGKLP